MDKRFIEESFPIKDVSKESAREKSIRHGHISTLHIWWARKPLSASRSIIYASLISKPQDEIDWIKKKNFISNFSKWENSLNQNLMKLAKDDILNNNNNVPPKVLDPFAGGGSIPLEALRMGCETYASDYNPVAVFLEKCTLEYPQKYGKKLIKDVEKWAKWILKETRSEIKIFYKNIQSDGFFDDRNKEEIPIGYYWMWSVSCQNPNCNSEIPLNTNWWLARKGKKRIAIYPIVNDHQIDYELVGTGHSAFPQNFDPSKGTVKRSSATCLVCGTVLDPKSIRKLFSERKAKEKLMAVVSYKKGKSGKNYTLATQEHLNEYETSKRYLEKKIDSLKEIGIANPVPDEELPLMSGTFNVPIYGFNKWGDLFNSRQKLSLLTFNEKILILQNKLKKEENYDEDYIKAILSYISIIFNRLADKNARLVVYDSGWEKISHVFGRPALPMIWDYIELNVFSGVNGDWTSNMKWVIKVLDHLTDIKGQPATISQSSAKELPYLDNYFDAVFTDPPYYNSVPYADLSDFFYVWLKRTIGNLYPDLFATPLAPKTKELAEMASWDKKRYSHKTKEYFEENFKEMLSEISRVLKPNGIVTIVYAHKTTEGWETVINAIMDSGLLVKASWPVSTEMKVRLRSMGSAALASSIYIVARKQIKNEIGWLKDVKAEIVNYVPQKLDKLWEEGISGADFFIAAIGSAIEIFGKYEKVLDNEGNEVRANKMLSIVRDVVTDYTVKQIVHNGITDILSPLTKFYILWRWNYLEARVPFDEARKLAQSAGIDLSNEWNKGFIVKRGEYISVIGPEKRDISNLEMSNELVDVIHLVCLLWKEGNTSKMTYILKESGYGNSEVFYKISQAIAETLPNSSSEKKMIEGFLAGRDRIVQDLREDQSQTKLI